MSYKVNTATYSGPFDLLLQLVSRQKVAIGSISISEVADQDLAEVDAMEELDLDVASDFVLVASTLLDMKAHALVPQDVSLKSSFDEDWRARRLTSGSIDCADISKHWDEIRILL